MNRNCCMCSHPKIFRIQTTMDSLLRQVEWLFLLSLSTVIVTLVSASVVFVDNATVSLSEQTNFLVEEELASNSESTEYQHSSKYANRETITTSVFNDLCRLHGNLPDSSVTSSQNQMNIKSRHAIDVLHEIFDPSFGLVPYISYTIQITYEEKGSFVYVLHSNLGKLTGSPLQVNPFCPSLNESSRHQLLQLTSMPTNLSWIIKSIPEVKTHLTLRLLAYSTETREFTSLAFVNHTIISGCYLKLHSTRGVVSSSHLPSQFESIQEHLILPTLGCSLLLKIPSASSFDFTLRKLKLLRPHSSECHEDSQLQLATSTTWGGLHKNSDSKHVEPSWSNLVENHHWQVMRTFCGKIQDYSKRLRTWHTFEPWVLIRYRSSQRVYHHTYSSNGIGSSFFVFKFNVLGPCSNVLLTEHSKTVELSELDFSAGDLECTFRIHVPYGYRIHLSADFHNEGRVSYDNKTIDDVVKGDEMKDNSLLLRNGRCQMTVHAEDITGHQTRCLNSSHPSVSFSSIENVLKFQAMLLQVISSGEQELKPFNNNSYGEARIPDSSIRLRVRYTSEADPRLTYGCGEGAVLIDETTCIWLHPEPLTWFEAEAKCSQFAPNGHLVAITNSEIQQVVGAVITKSADYEPGKSYWIGGSDQKQETIFEWSSGADFSYTKWFPGWPVFQLYNAQPSDDGISNQDCVEIRKMFGQPSHSNALASGFYWNDRDCAVANPFVCQKSRNDGSVGIVFKDTMNCNRTEDLNRLRTSTLVQSPFFPKPYPNGITCIVDLSAPLGFKIVLNFEFFDLEEEEDCNYDVLDLQNLEEKSSFDEHRDASANHWRRCGNWNSRLKLLQWKSNGNKARIKFISDSSFNTNGFKLKASIERADLSCPEAGSIYHPGRCYLIAPYPEISWLEANRMCKSIQAELVLLSDNNSDEMHFLIHQINSNEQLNSTDFYWIGQTNRFQLSIPQSADVIQKCPAIHVTPSILMTPQKLEPCGSLGGYVCEKTVKSNRGLARNSSIESREGEMKSPNYPAPYGEDNHFRLHIKAPNSSSESERLVLRFKQIDIEFQENCLYDYLGLQSRENGPMQKICGHYTTNLERLDYVSETAEIWITFHSDFSVSGNGFHAVWSTMSLVGCPQKTIKEPQGELFSPHYPSYLLPNLNCTYHIVAPEGTRVWIKFHVFDIDFNKGRQQLLCRDEYVRLDWGSSNSIVLCGSHNLSRDSLQWISDDNQLKVNLMSRNGKQGRGFHASYKFMPIPTTLIDTLFLNTDEELELIPFNYPRATPNQLLRRIILVTHHGSYLRHKSASWMKPCDNSSFRPSVTGVGVLRDVYNNNTEIELCYTNETVVAAEDLKPILYDSLFHTLTIEYTHAGINWPGVLGRVKALKDPSYAEKVSAMPDDSSVESCDNDPCQNEGVCTALDDQFYCQCRGNWRGLFCSLTLCQLPSLCINGFCSTFNETQRCNCDPGFTGHLCESRLSPCDLDPCGDRGKCVSSVDDFVCQCHPWWQGLRCETRWLNLPYKPLSQRMLEEPFWLGLMTIAIVLIVIAFVWCAKRHFAEKFERFVSEELERGKLVEPAMLDWSRGRHLCHQFSVDTSAISRPVSPHTNLNAPVAEPMMTQKNFLGWPSFRKPSLPSITSLISPSQSHTSVAGPPSGGGSCSKRSGVCNQGQRSGRTFSLDDLLRLSKRSPSPNKRGSDDDVASQRRDIERQQILQRLIASQVPGKPGHHTSSPGEMIMMTQFGLQTHSGLLAAIPDTSDGCGMDTAMASQLQLQLDLKAEKKVTFARMMEMVKADITSSETETSAGEEPSKCIVDGRMTSDSMTAANKRKQRSWNSRRFWRSNNSNSSTQGSASDQDIQDNLPVTETMPSNDSLSWTNIGKGHRHLRLPSRTTSTSGRHASSTESLLSILRNFSTNTNNHRTPSTPSSPQISDYELSSSFPTPLSTPGSPAGSFEAIPTPSNLTDTSSIQVAVIDPSGVTHRSNRLSTTNFSAPHITLEIPTINYGQFLSPIHEVPTPLPSPAHTPIPSMRKTDQCGSSDLSSGNNSTLLGRKRPLLQQQKWNYNSSDECSNINRCDSSAPSILVENVTKNPENSERQSISIVVPSTIQILIESDSTQPSPISSTASSPLPSPAKIKPPPLNILNSNFSRFETFKSGTETNKFKLLSTALTVPHLCVSEAIETTDSENLQTGCKLSNFQTRNSQCNSMLKLEWEHVSLGSPPLQKHLPGDVTVNVADNLITDTITNIRRVFKDTLDKSSSLELPHPPPTITITTNFSEVESDSDVGMLGRGGTNNQKMCYLSPFVCYGASRPDIATSESNLSSSGYSSMTSPTASPGVSPACSSKTLCIWMEEEDTTTINRTYMRRKDRRVLHRAILSPSLESSSPPLDSPLDNCSSDLSNVNRSHRLIYFSDSEKTDQSKNVLCKSVPKSASPDESHDEGIDVFHVCSNVINRLDHSCLIDSKLLNLTRVHKSTSLDSKLMGQRRHNLKGDSLDTKLPSVQSLQLPELLSWTYVGNDGKNDEIKMKVSPVSSRSESPLSDVKSTGLGRFSTKFYGMSRNDLPYTDSDGLYDYPSSETILPPTSIHRRHIRHNKCDRRRERKTSFKSSRIDSHRELLDSGTVKRPFLDPCDRGVGRVSAKRKSRVRAQSNIDFCASSSSNESISSFSKRPRPKKGPQIINLRRGSSPICNVILTIQAASSLDESQSEVSEEKHENEVMGCASIELKAFKLPVRTRQNTAFRFPERRRQDSISKRREMPIMPFRNSRGLKTTCLTSEGVMNFKEISSADTSYTESDICDSNESLANLGEIEDSVDSPLV